MMRFVNWWHRLDDGWMVDVKATVAIIGAGLLLWYFLAEFAPALQRYPWLKRGRRLRDVLLVTLGLVGSMCWWNLGRYHFNSFIHYYEFYHYYLGAKYAPELGYTRIYECTVAAEDEFAHLGPRLERLQIRDLTNNVLTTPMEALAHPERCKEHFTPERWQAFMADSDFFRRASNWDFWSSALKDHGYNATPVWRIAAGLLANLRPIDDDFLHDLALVDPILLITMFMFVGWAFGWRTLCCCLIFWGTNYPGRYWWTGGAFLRMDWLFAMVLSICFMKKGRPFLSGAAIAVATLLRVFPGFVVVAVLVKIIEASIRQRKLVLTTAHKRFIAGGAVAVALLVPIATWYGGGVQCWKGFVENSRKHVSTPLTNNMGLKAVIAYKHSTRAQLTKRPDEIDPFLEWKHHQQDNFDRRKIAFYALVLAFLILTGMAVSRHDDWIALVVGVGLILVCAELTCYYFIGLLALGLLWPYIGWSGAALLVTSALSCWIPNYLIGWDDVRYVVISVIDLALLTALTIWLAKAPLPVAAVAEASEPSRPKGGAAPRKKRRRGRSSAR